MLCVAVKPFLTLALLAVTVASAAAGDPEVVAVSVNSVVHPITVQVITHAVDQAQRENASILLVRLNTPGGMLEATREIIEKLVSSPVPVVTFVTPSGGRAASAGFFLLEAGDVAAMSDGTNTGAASPVTLGQPLDPVMRRKIENDTSAGLRSLVAKRGRNVELAEKTVSEAKSFTEKEALDAKLIDLVVRDQADLLSKLNGREITRFDGRKQVLNTAGARVVEYQPSLREKDLYRPERPEYRLPAGGGRFALYLCGVHESGPGGARSHRSDRVRSRTVGHQRTAARLDRRGAAADCGGIVHPGGEVYVARNTRGGRRCGDGSRRGDAD